VKSAKDIRAALLGSAAPVAAKPATPATVNVSTVMDAVTFAVVNGYSAALIVRFPANPEYKGSAWQSEHDEVVLYRDAKAAAAFVGADNRWTGARQFSRTVRVDVLEAASAALKARK